jgi:hypothetical protein
MPYRPKVATQQGMRRTATIIGRVYLLFLGIVTTSCRAWRRSYKRRMYVHLAWKRSFILSEAMLTRLSTTGSSLLRRWPLIKRTFHCLTSDCHRSLTLPTGVWHWRRMKTNVVRRSMIGLVVSSRLRVETLECRQGAGGKHRCMACPGSVFPGMERQGQVVPMASWQG